MSTISRFDLNGTDYDYATDIVDVGWEADGNTYARLDGETEIDFRKQRVVIQFDAVFQSENSNTSDVTAAELWDLIRQEIVAGNPVHFVPDISVTGAPNTNPPEVEITLDLGSYPSAFRTERGTGGSEALRRRFTVIGKRWLDPTDTTVGGDKETIDDLNFLTTVL